MPTTEPLVYDPVLHEVYDFTCEPGRPDWIRVEGNFGRTAEQVHDAVADQSILDWPALPDGRSLVLDAALNLVALAPGRIDTAARWAYTRGQCLALAIALAEEAGWPVLLFGDPDLHTPPLRFRHAVAETPAGHWFDINGFDFADDRYWHLRLTATEARALLPSLHDLMPPQHLDLAATFVRPLLADLGPGRWWRS